MRYKYVRMKCSIGGKYYHKTENGKMSPRQVIEDMAAQGCRYVGNVPVQLGRYGALIEYDMIFEY